MPEPSMRVGSVAIAEASAKEAAGRATELPIYLINRDKDTGRLAHMRQAAEAERFAFTRVPAVEGFAVPERFRDQFLSAPDTPHARMFPGEVGCYASHLVCCQIIVDSGHAAALVIEDDIELTAGFLDVVRATLAAAGTDWDIVRLSSQPRGAVLSVAQLDQTHHLVKYLRLPKLTGAQLWSRRGAERFLKSRPRLRAVDADLRYGWESNLKMLGVYPPPAVQTEAFTSGISKAGVSRRKARGGSWQKITLASRLQGMRTRVADLGLVGTGKCLAYASAEALGMRRGTAVVRGKPRTGSRKRAD